MVHLIRITAYGSNRRVPSEIAIALSVRVQLPTGRQPGSYPETAFEEMKAH